MWSDGYSLSLTLGKSLFYRKVLYILYGLAAWEIYCAGFLWWIKGMLSVVLLIHGIPLMRKAMPSCDPTHLFYQGNAWWCERPHQETERFDQAILVLHAGLFFLLKLQAEKKQRLLVIFIDQITPSVFRQLMWIQLIQRKNNTELLGSVDISPVSVIPSDSEGTPECGKNLSLHGSSLAIARDDGRQGKEKTFTIDKL